MQRFALLEQRNSERMGLALQTTTSENSPTRPRVLVGFPFEGTYGILLRGSQNELKLPGALRFRIESRLQVSSRGLRRKVDDDVGRAAAAIFQPRFRTVLPVSELLNSGPVILFWETPAAKATCCGRDARLVIRINLFGASAIHRVLRGVQNEEKSLRGFSVIPGLLPQAQLRARAPASSCPLADFCDLRH
jgi:hypothetical protein